MANTIKIKRGLSSNISNITLAQGELAITTDTNELYVGTANGNVKLNDSKTGAAHLLDGINDGSLRSSGSLEEDDEYTLGYDAVALGSETKASGWASHAEGGKCKATAQAAHAEGYYCEASGLYSHAEGWRTTAAGEYQHVQGKFNITDETLASIVGNGTAYNKLSNIHTLDWNGNAWYQGDVYTGSSSGTNKDTGSKKLATEDYVDERIRILNSLPLNAIVEYEGTTVPTGWESYTTNDAYTQTTLWNTTSWDSMLTPNTVKSLNMSSYDYVEVTFTGQGGTNSTTEILKIDLKEQFKIAMSISSTSYMYGASICFPDIQLLQGSNNDPGIFRIGALVSTDKTKLWVGDTGYFTGQTSSGNFDQSGVYARVSKVVGIKKINRIRKTSESTYAPSSISEPKITVISSSIATISADNEEIRCVGSNGTLSSLTVYFDNALTFTNLTKFSSSLVFKTSSNGCSFTMNPPTSVSLKMAGDDVTDGNFSPQSNKVYDIVFYWNGFYLNGIVKGTEVKTYEITVENGGSDSSYASFNIYTKEDASDLTTIEWSNSKKLTLTQDHLYIEYTSEFMEKCKEALNCELESVTSRSDSSGVYSRYKVTITDSPAYVKFLCWQDGATV